MMLSNIRSNANTQAPTAKYPVHGMRPIRTKLLKPAVRWYLNELQIEADYRAAVARQQNPIWYRGMMLMINWERLLEDHEVPQVFQSKQYPANQVETVFRNKL